MEIYSCETDVLVFSAPYNVKRLLDDSVERTSKGFSAIINGSVASGVCNALLARVESAAAFSLQLKV